MNHQENTRRSRFGSLLLTAILTVLTAASSQNAAADTIGNIQSTREALASTAAIVEGSVVRHTYTYDDMAGPRTVATLIDLTTHFGAPQDRALDVAMLGGRITDDRWLYIPELPRLTEDTRYLLFLTNVDWFYSPLVADYIFRLEPGPRGRDVLIAPSGHAVVGVSAEGLDFTPEPVVDTQLDFLTPHAKQRLIDPALLDTALTKDDFLAAVRELLGTAPLQGSFRRAPAGDRIWNRTATVEEPQLR